MIILESTRQYCYNNCAKKHKNGLAQKVASSCLKPAADTIMEASTRLDRPNKTCLNIHPVLTCLVANAARLTMTFPTFG